VPKGFDDDSDDRLPQSGDGTRLDEGGQRRAWSRETSGQLPSSLGIGLALVSRVTLAEKPLVQGVLPGGRSAPSLGGNKSCLIDVHEMLRQGVPVLRVDHWSLPAESSSGDEGGRGQFRCLSPHPPLAKTTRRQFSLWRTRRATVLPQEGATSRLCSRETRTTPRDLPSWSIGQRLLATRRHRASSSPTLRNPPLTASSPFAMPSNQVFSRDIPNRCDNRSGSELGIKPRPTS
jgi:hypothetical protein